MVMGLRSVELMILLNAILAAKAALAADYQAKPGCQANCGNVGIPYPFGTSDDCNINQNFSIRCNDSSSPKPFFGDNEVLGISLDGQLRILTPATYDCYDSSGRSAYHRQSFGIGGFLINSSRNKFTAIGCDTYALVQSSSAAEGHYATGCVSICNNISNVRNGSCSGIGCCQTNIPEGVGGYNINLSIYANHSDVLPENPCSYAFVAEDGAYSFSTSDLRGFDFRHREFPVTLDWTVGKQSCNEAKKDSENFACQENSICIDSQHTGYLCRCSEGFEGNPYLSGGCQDIDECETIGPCNTTCYNLPGGRKCSCPEGFEGDWLKNGTGCSSPKKNHTKGSLVLDVALGIAIFVLALVLGIVLYLMFRQRQNYEQRNKYFHQNGGFLLCEISKVSGVHVRIFAAEELEKATNNYDESQILGQGGQGTVYKGTLDDGRKVAIKRSGVADQSKVEQFVNEILVLCQVHHKNVVKLLGCCFETPVPLLVYEYVNCGSLYDHLHRFGPASVLTWEIRLRIATETARALYYMHTAAPIPIIHRDIKSANILLDYDYTAKVSDFGISRLVISGQSGVYTVVQGTLGYLDPEFFLTHRLTEKCDVYSFGVVLMELLTGQPANFHATREGTKSLVTHFVSFKDDRLLDFLDPWVVNDGNLAQLKEVAALAWLCVRESAVERPSMREVVLKLENLQGSEELSTLLNSENLEERALFGNRIILPSPKKSRWKFKSLGKALNPFNLLKQKKVRISDIDVKDELEPEHP